MKRIWFILILSLLLPGCAPGNLSITPTQPNTRAVLTIQPQFTNESIKARPSSTITVTPSPRPTKTPTFTASPTPTRTVGWVKNPVGRVTAPILLYYNVADNSEDDPYLFIDQKESTQYINSRQFEQEMMALRDLGYTGITISHLSSVIRDGGLLPPRPVVITFDSNKLGVYKKAFPIMKKYGFLGSIFVTVNQLMGNEAELNSNGAISANQVKELYKAGWDVGSRGLTGRSLVDVSKINIDALVEEIYGSRQELKTLIGVSAPSFSYPDSAVDKQGVIISRVKEWGYLSAVGALNSSDHTTRTLYFLSRYKIPKDLSVYVFTSYLPWKGGVLSPQTKSFFAPGQYLDLPTPGTSIGTPPTGITQTTSTP